MGFEQCFVWAKYQVVGCDIMQGGFQQQQQQQRGGAGSGQVLMSEQAYIQHCQQLATANGTPFDLQVCSSSLSTASYLHSLSGLVLCVCTAVYLHRCCFV